VRRDGYGAADAEDLTQEFLSQFIHKDWLNHLQDQRGKFRSFLLTFLKHFLSDQRAHAGALKRGGGATIIPLDELAAEEHGALSTADSLSADQIFEQRWARTLLTRAETCLREEHVAAGQAGLYEALKDVLEGGATEDGYAQIAARFGMTESAIKSKVRRLRQRHQEILREEIGRTVSRREEIDEEIRYLISVLGR
jgi:RNA polymerase sigma-70 factor (ECF subfamily)